MITKHEGGLTGVMQSFGELTEDFIEFRMNIFRKKSTGALKKMVREYETKLSKFLEEVKNREIEIDEEAAREEVSRQINAYKKHLMESEGLSEEQAEKMLEDIIVVGAIPIQVEQNEELKTLDIIAQMADQILHERKIAKNNTLH